MASPPKLPSPKFRHLGHGLIEVEGGLPRSFYALRQELRALGRLGQYRAMGGTFVEFRFPSGRTICQMSHCPGNPSVARLDRIFHEPFDRFSSAVVLELEGVPGRQGRKRLEDLTR